MLNPEQLTKAVEEFKFIYKEEFGIELSDEDATEKAKGVLELLSVAKNVLS